MKFAASWNHTTKFSTMCAVLTMVILPSLLSVWNVPPAFIAGTMVVTVVIGVISWGLGPQDYSVDAEGIDIRRPIKKVRIAASDIKQVRVMTKSNIGVPIRVSGNGGLFGFYGRFYSRKLGWQHWYATRSVDLVGVETTTEGWIILSPDDREGFVEAVRGIMPASALAALAGAVNPLDQSAILAAYLEPEK